MPESPSPPKSTPPSPVPPPEPLPPNPPPVPPVGGKLGFQPDSAADCQSTEDSVRRQAGSAHRQVSHDG